VLYKQLEEGFFINIVISLNESDFISDVRVFGVFDDYLLHKSKHIHKTKTHRIVYFQSSLLICLSNM